MLGSRIRTALGAASIALLALALVAPAGASAQGNGKKLGHSRKAAMQVCKKGGWRTVEKEDGTRFKNQGRCVSYLVRGGTVTELETAVTIAFAPSATVEGSCDATGSVEDLAANRTYAGDLVIDTVTQPQVSILTDASGEGSALLGTVLPGSILNLTVDGISSDDQIATCEGAPI